MTYIMPSRYMMYVNKFWKFWASPNGKGWYLQVFSLLLFFSTFMRYALSFVLSKFYIVLLINIIDSRSKAWERSWGGSNWQSQVHLRGWYALPAGGRSSFRETSRSQKGHFWRSSVPPTEHGREPKVSFLDCINPLLWKEFHFMWVFTAKSSL